MAAEGRRQNGEKHRQTTARRLALLISVLTSLKIDTTTKMHPVIYGLETGENRVFNGGNAHLHGDVEGPKEGPSNCLTIGIVVKRLHHTILAINIRTALKCHSSLNFSRSEMIFFSKFASSKNLSNETKLVPVSLFV